MSARAHALADRFQQVAEAFALEVERLSPQQWQASCPEEGRTVAALAHHVAWAYMVEMEAFLAMAEARPARSWSKEALARANAELGDIHAACNQVETVQLLRRNAAEAAARVRQLTDAHLACTGIYEEEAPAETVDVWIDEVLIGHPGRHLPAIRAATREQRGDG
jgi:hypothetical protein